MRNAALILSVLIVGCGRDEDDGSKAGAVIAGEARALDEAAEMLEARRDSDPTQAPTPAPPSAPTR